MQDFLQKPRSHFRRGKPSVSLSGIENAEFIHGRRITIKIRTTALNLFDLRTLLSW